MPPVRHKLIRTHLDGSQSLHISPVYMERIVGWDQAEARALVQKLTVWATQDRFVYEHCSDFCANDLAIKLVNGVGRRQDKIPGKRNRSSRK